MGRPETIEETGELADAYGVTGTDGSRPDCQGYLAAYGWERGDAEGIEEFRQTYAPRVESQAIVNLVRAFL